MAFFLTQFNINILLCVATIILLLYKLFTRNFNYWERLGVPYIKPIPLFGNFYNATVLRTDIGECLARLYRKMKKHPYFGIWIFNQPHLIVKSPELIKAILVKDFNYFQDRTIVSDESADPIAANFIFFVKNPKWREIRMKMTPIFTSGKMKSMFDLFNKAGKDLNNHLKKVVADGKTVESKEICSKYTTDSLTSAAFGINAHCFDREDSDFRRVGRELFQFNLYRAFKSICYFFIPSLVPLLKLTFFDNSTIKYLRGAFWETIHEREKSNFKRNDLIDLLIQLRHDEKSQLTHTFDGDRVVAQAVQFFAAGFETTSSTMAFTLYEMCLHPEMQDRLRKEIKESLSQNGGLTYEGLQNMKYLKCVVSETLRMYPVLPFLDRKVTMDYKLPGTDLVLTKGSNVYIPMMGLHLDPDYFPNPDVYDPERFNEENIGKIIPYSYIPFGEGPHNCIGERFGLLVAKIGLVHILSDFKVVRCKETPVPIKVDPKSFVMQSLTGLPMQFQKA